MESYGRELSPEQRSAKIGNGTSNRQRANFSVQNLQMRRIVHILTITFTIFSAVATHATCIVIYRVNNVFYIAADSRRSFDAINRLDTICKIHNKNSFYFTVAGHDDEFLTREAYKAVGASPKIDVVVANYLKAVKDRYNGIMPRERQLMPASYRYYLSNALADVAFIFFVNGTPRIYQVEFIMREENNYPVIKHAIFKDQELTILGYKDHILSLSTREMPKVVVPGNPLATVENFVLCEAKHHKGEVSAPVDLLIISGSAGVQWTRRQKKCK
jgi:hypothetical protein